MTQNWPILNHAGQLTGGIAHDFNNVLAAVMGSLEVIRSRLAAGRTDILRFADNAYEAAGRAAGLTAQLLSFARRQRLDPRPLDPVAVVEGMRALLARTAGYRIAFRVEVAGTPGPCLADRNQLESAVLNLVINARDAIAGMGTITVSIRAAHLDGPSGEGGAPGGDYVRIAVADDGSGMPEEVRRHAFEPFFTTKGPGKGSGLGLSQIHGFAHQSGGTVLLESAPGRGTEVAILLPRAGAPTERQGKASTDLPPPRGDGETVLLVEDDETVRLPLATFLRDLGYAVAEAETAEAGLARLDGGAGVILTDLVMPGRMDGIEFAAAARTRHPGLPVLLLTGHLDPLRGASLPQGVIFLQKPCDRFRIAAALRSALRGRVESALA